MKKLLALLMAMLLMLSMAACGGITPPTGTVSGNQTETNEQATPNEDVKDETTEETENETPDETLSFGSTSGSVYENKALGIGFKAPAGWTFKTKAELAALAGTTAEALGGDVEEALKNATAVYDMQAVSADLMTNVLVAFENLGVVNGLLVDVDTYIDSAIDQMDSQLAAANAEILKCEKASFTVGGETFSGIKIHMKTSGIDTYQSMLCIKAGNYIGLVNVTTLMTDTTADIFNCFYTV